MARYEAFDADMARRMVDRFLVQGGDTASRALDFGPTVRWPYFKDVETESQDFQRDMVLLGRLGVGAPVLRFADRQILASLSWLVDTFGPRRGAGRPGYLRPIWWFSHRRQLREDFVLLALQTSADYVDRVSAREADSNYREAATEFLATRIAYMRQDDPDAPRPPRTRGDPRGLRGPGCRFTVTTNTSGLRVFWSGAYRISSNYFGHPTTPTHRVMHAGTYVFGVDGGPYGQVVQWDRNTVVALPGPPSAHLNY